MKKYLPLGLIVLFFLVTRLYKISQIPASVYWDEASIGYNAFAVATDLKDEWGDTLPLHFRAFGEFKLPVYVYSAVASVKLFGLSAFSARFPAVLYALGSVITLFFLIRKITGKDSAGYMASLILTVSPWFFIFSRTGYEATAGLFFFLLGNYLFFLIGRNKYFIIAGTLSFILSFFSYNSFRIIIPIWLLGLVLYLAKDFKKIRRYFPVLIISSGVFLISLIPVYRLYRFDTGAVRLSTVAVEKTSDYFKNYLAHFSYSFLFDRGDANPRSQIPGRGQLYLIEIPFIIFGLVLIFNKKKMFWLILFALLISPIPASLTRESPHALRSILAAPSYAAIAAMGVVYIAEVIKKYSNITLALFVAVYGLSFMSYYSDFLTNYQKESASAWQYEYKEIFDRSTGGVVTDEYAQPYIFALFYLKYPPQDFRNTVKYNPLDKWGFSTVESFGDFQFKKL